MSECCPAFAQASRNSRSRDDSLIEHWSLHISRRPAIATISPSPGHRRSGFWFPGSCLGTHWIAGSACSRRGRAPVAVHSQAEPGNEHSREKAVSKSATALPCGSVEPAARGGFECIAEYCQQPPNLLPSPLVPRDPPKGRVTIGNISATKCRLSRPSSHQTL